MDISNACSLNLGIFIASQMINSSGYRYFMSFISIMDTLRKGLDLAIMWYLVYALLKNIKKNVTL